MRPASPHISADETAALPRRGIVGIDTGVDEDLFKETLLEEFVLRTLEVAKILEVGEGLDLGVVKVLRVLEADLDAGSRPRAGPLGGESSERTRLASRLSSDMMSMRCVSFGALPGDMLSRTEARAAGGIVSTGCATMISPECALADSLDIGIQRVRQEIDVDLLSLLFSL